MYDPSVRGQLRVGSRSLDLFPTWCENKGQKGVGNEEGTNLSEQATATAAAEIDVHIVIFTADWFFDKGLFHYFTIDDDGISILAHGYLWGDAEIAEVNAEFIEHELLELWIDTWTCVSGDF